MVSVLMSVYNAPASFLRESIDSILQQSYRDFEFIIINDGCTKGDTVDTLNEYEKKDSRIQLICNEENIGLTKSLNRGMKYAKGKYIARMDADDIALKNRLEKQVLYMESHEDIVVLGTQVEKFGKKQKNEPMYFIDYTHGNYEKFLINMLFCNIANIHPTVMLRRIFFQEHHIEYDEKIERAQDYKLWIDCIAQGGKLFNLPDVLLRYRVHENQITSKKEQEQKKCIYLIAKDAMEEKGFCMNEEEFDLLTDLYTDSYRQNPQSYIEAILKMQEINETKQIFSGDVFEKTLKIRWIHKVLKCLIKHKEAKGLFCRYTWSCFFSLAFLSWIEDYLLRGK